MSREVYISQNISELRRRKNISQSILGDVVGKSKETINGYEKGRSEPPLKIIVSLAAYFDVTLDELVHTDLSVMKSNEPEQVYTASPQSDILRIVAEEWQEVKQEVKDLKERMRRLEESG